MTPKDQTRPIEKKLGKIEKVNFGFVPDRTFLMSLNITLSGSGWGCGTCLSYNISDTCKWENKGQRGDFAYEFLTKVADILNKAKVDSVDQLKNKPIEASFNGMVLVDWRILEEVL
ncbi:hypothetical protein MASR1M48_16880 [Lactococcus petauri]